MITLAKKHKFQRIPAAFLALCLFLPVFSSAASAASEEELEQLKQERDSLVSQRQQQQGLVDQLYQQQAGLLQIKQALDTRNAYTLLQMQLNQQEIDLYDRMIAEKSQAVEDASAREETQLRLYRSRVRSMEENGNLSFLSLLLDSADLGELLTAIDDIGEIMKADKKLHTDYVLAREQTVAARAEYERCKLQAEQTQAELREQQAELQEEMEEAEAFFYTVTDQLAANTALLEEFEAAEKQAETNVANMVIALERERLAAQANTGNGGTGSSNAAPLASLIWPAPTSSTVTSRFGMRIHPVTGMQKSHTGMDVAANTGDPILATADGTVTMAGVNGGYGNCVMIDHGNGYRSLYGHMSAIAVSNGAKVSAGTVIGYIGSTGVSTGPHLHFEVWSAGSRIDPEQFFSGLSFTESAGV